jgi:hypothetical protein
MPGYLDAQHVVASAARIGMEQFKVAWGDKPADPVELVVPKDFAV